MDWHDDWQDGAVTACCCLKTRLRFRFLLTLFVFTLFLVTLFAVVVVHGLFFVNISPAVVEPRKRQAK
jgi:hypothetical protein